MKIIVSGGGSGGHIYPALAIADKFKENDQNCEVLYIGNTIGIESDIVPQYGYEFKTVKGRYLDIINIKEVTKTSIAVIKGIFQSLSIMRKYKPDIVIGTGGYVCVPVIIASKLYGAKTYIHEQNAVPGMTNKLLEHFCHKVFLGFEHAKKHFKKQEKMVLVGNPVREIFYNVDKKVAKKNIGVNETQFTVFIFGGSQGADAMNEVAYTLMEYAKTKKNFVLIFCTGPDRFDIVNEKIAERNIEISKNIKIIPYINNMEDYIHGSDLIISRAGALSIAEINVAGKPSILIPSPNVMGNHQYYNGKAVVDFGGAIMVEEKELTKDVVISKLEDIMDDRAQLELIGKKSKEFSLQSPTQLIYEGIVQ